MSLHHTHPQGTGQRGDIHLYGGIPVRWTSTESAKFDNSQKVCDTAIDECTPHDKGTRALLSVCVWGAQSSFKLQRFLCSKGYAMDNLDETQNIHLSLKLHVCGGGGSPSGWGWVLPSGPKGAPWEWNLRYLDVVAGASLAPSVRGGGGGGGRGCHSNAPLTTDCATASTATSNRFCSRSGDPFGRGKTGLRPRGVTDVHFPPPKECWAMVREHKTRSAQSAERNVARQWPTRP